MKKLLVFLMLLMLVSCGVQKQIVEVPVPIETVKTEYIRDIQYDSIYVHDSIDRYRANDTLIIYKYKELYKYKFKTDTLVVRDSIQVPVEVRVETIKEVNKIKGWQNFLMYSGIGFLAIIAFSIYKLVRRVLGK